MDTDKVHTYIEDCLGRLEPINKTYGFQHTVTLMNLERAGFLRPHGNRTYPTIKKSLRLIVEDVNEVVPNDISYVFRGYAPLSIRLAQYYAQPGWRSITEVLNLLPGPTVEEIQQIPVALRKRRSSIASMNSSKAEQKVTLVFFLGGITYAEIAALRFLAQQDDDGTDYVIAATSIVSGDTLIKQISEHLEPVKLNPF